MSVCSPPNLNKFPETNKSFLLLSSQVRDFTSIETYFSRWMEIVQVNRCYRTLKIWSYLSYSTWKRLEKSNFLQSKVPYRYFPKISQGAIFIVDNGGKSFWEHVYGPFESAVDCINIVCKPISTLYTITGGVHILVQDFKNLGEIATNTERHLFKWVQHVLHIKLYMFIRV